VQALGEYLGEMTTNSTVLLPHETDGIDADFLTRAMGSKFAGTAIESVEMTDVHQGSGSTFRLVLTYAANPHGLPPSVYLKGNFVAHGYTADAAFRGEASYFADFAERLRGALNQPRAYFVGIDGAGQALIVMEDLTRRPVTLNDCESPLTVEQVADGVAQLAAMHAAFWADDKLGADSISDLSSVAPLMMFLVQPDHFDDYISRERAAYLPGALKNREGIAAALSAMFHCDRQLPNTLCHGDAHLGNTFLDPDGRVGFLDFQGVGRGPYIWDITYFLTGALTPEDRRNSERDLLDWYRNALHANGVAEAPSREEIFLAHRQHMMHGYLNILIPVEMQPDRFAVSMGKRFATAMLDLDTLASFD
jgi:aminoglycoside/choline kinase family phosphotransferase